MTVSWCASKPVWQGHNRRWPSRCSDSTSSRWCSSISARAQLRRKITYPKAMGPSHTTASGGGKSLPLHVLFEAHEALVADDDVIDQLDVQEATGLHELFGRLDV